MKKDDYLAAESRTLADRFFDGAMKQMVVSFLDQKDLTLKTWMNCRVSWTKSAGNEAIMMFLEQFLIGNLWNACLICVMLGLKWLLRNRLSLTFPVSQLVCPAWSFFSVIAPKLGYGYVTTRENPLDSRHLRFQCFPAILL